MTSLFTKVTLVPTVVTSTEGFTPLAVMVTTVAAGCGGWGTGLGDGTAGVGDGADGVSVDPQLAAEIAMKAPTTQEITFACRKRRWLSCA